MAGGFDVDSVRADFPLLRAGGVAYLDSAATAQKPAAVLAAERAYYERMCANIHRGVYRLSEEATLAYEAARDRLQRFLNARDRSEIVFVRGTTEAINLVAQSFARPRLREGDEILLTHMEHHSNIVPWQLVAGQTGACLRVAPVRDDGSLDQDAFERLLGPRTRLVAVAHVSNAIGTVNPVRRIVEAAHAQDVPVLIDGAQAVPHFPVDVQALGCDFYAFSGHKLFGPTGIGVLYGRSELLESMPPYHGGGDMILSVTFEKTTYNALPYRFEAGTPHVAGALGLAAAADYLGTLDRAAAEEHERGLLAYGTKVLGEIEGLRLIGTAPGKVGVLSFVLDCAHPHDIGTILDGENVAIRTGHHCAQPLMQRFGVAATARASLAFYNTQPEIDALAAALRRVREIFS